jgi:PKD repeat protein
MYKWMAVYAAIMATFAAKAQTRHPEAHTMCHTDAMVETFLTENPWALEEVIMARETLEERTRNFSDTRRDGEPYIISVVFHIVHNNGIENISDAQVRDCIRVMNEDFTASNAGVNTVNAAFQDIIGNVGVEFRLAQKDPQGNCTNGIVRTVSAITAQGGENLKAVSPIWDRSRYMNVWVCANIESGAAAYTYYPSTLAGSFGVTNDGIVARHDYVGSIGTSSVGRSHVLTHEVGHWINLAHPWGSTNEPGVASNCDTDDWVDDTPNTVGWTVCNVNGQSCGSLDNVENFMDYSYCHKMFTQGQKTRMLASLTSQVAQRSNLWQEETLISTGVLDTPVLCDADFQATRRDFCAGGSTVFTDNSYNGVSARTWIFEGGVPATSSSESPTVTYPNPGLYSASLLASDGINTATEVKASYIRVLSPGFSALPFAEGFENMNAFDGGVNDVWYINPETAGQNWEITSAAAYSGSKSARVRGRLNGANSTADLYSQTFDLSGVSQNAVLSFKYAHAMRNANSNDRLRVWISRNCGDLWSVRRTITGSSLATVSGFVPGEFVPQNQSDWQEVTIPNIVSVFLNASFRVRFEFTSGSGNNIYIDDINLVDAATVTSVAASPVVLGTFQAYPNPAEGAVALQFETVVHTSGAVLQISDLTGRVVAQHALGDLPAGEYMLEKDLSQLAGGLYVVTLVGDGKPMATQKLVLR